MPGDNPQHDELRARVDDRYPDLYAGGYCMWAMSPNGQTSYGRVVGKSPTRSEVLIVESESGSLLDLPVARVAPLSERPPNYAPRESGVSS